MNRLLVIYNPRSSRHGAIQKEVLDRVKGMSGYALVEYEVERTDVDKNAVKLAGLLEDGDLVLAVGGDGTATIGANGILRSGKDVTLAVLPYGNFNDLARTLGIKEFEDIFDAEIEVKKLYPLEIRVEGELFRYATCYVTIGMMAEAVEVFEEPKLRRRLRLKVGRELGSYVRLARWYFRNRRRQFLPKWKLNGTQQRGEVTDYLAVNGRSMARVMKGGEDCYDPRMFRSGVGQLASFWRLMKLMTKSVLKQVPGEETTGDKIEFAHPATVGLQAEGEYRKFEDVKKIEIKKSRKVLKVVTLNR